MTTYYHISGLKCQGCADTVTDKLAKVLGVTKVEVDVAKQEVAVTGFALPFLLKRALKGTRFELSAKAKE